MKPLAFFDTETTGLDHIDHEIWQVGGIRINDLQDFLAGEPGSYQILDMSIQNSDLSLRKADPVALAMNHFWDPKSKTPTRASQVAEVTYHFLRDTTVIGAVPWFDTRFTEKLLYEHGLPPGGWHYHMMDIESAIIGYLQFSQAKEMLPPWKYSDLLEMIGIKEDQTKKHSAFYDAKTVLLAWLKIGELDTAFAESL